MTGGAVVARIFLSYASEDRDRAREIAADLEALGWAVWWDHKLQAGKTFAGVIESEIKKSDCVLVLWSKASITSRWVRDEANEGLERGVLVPVLIDAVEPPMGFRSIHAANLVGYDGDQTSPGFRQLVADLRALLTPGATPAQTLSGDPRSSAARTGADWRMWVRRLVPAVLGIAIVAAGTFGVMRYFDDVDRRTAELESRQKAFDDARRRTEEDGREAPGRAGREAAEHRREGAGDGGRGRASRAGGRPAAGRPAAHRAGRVRARARRRGGRAEGRRGEAAAGAQGAAETGRAARARAAGRHRAARPRARGAGRGGPEAPGRRACDRRRSPSRRDRR